MPALLGCLVRERGSKLRALQTLTRISNVRLRLARVLGGGARLLPSPNFFDGLIHLQRLVAGND